MKFDERTGKVEGVEGVVVSRFVYSEPTELYVDLPGGKNMVVRASSTVFDQYSISTPTLSVTIKDAPGMLPKGHNIVRLDVPAGSDREEDPWTNYSEADE